MSASKTAEAAAKAVARSKKSETVELTPIQIIQGIRNSLAARLAVTPNDVRVLLLEYDKVRELMVQGTESIANGIKTIEFMGSENDALRATVVDLTTKNEEFRRVYEQENQSMTFKAERLPLGAPDSTESGNVESVPEPTPDPFITREA
jgi:hypothetical protein